MRDVSSGAPDRRSFLALPPSRPRRFAFSGNQRTRRHVWKTREREREREREKDREIEREESRLGPDFALSIGRTDYVIVSGNYIARE